MKIIVSRTHLFAKLQGVGKIVKSSREVAYSSFLFEVKDEKLTVTGCDESGQVKTGVECVIEEAEDKQLLLDAQLLLNALKELPEQPIQILTREDDSVDLVYSNGRFKIPTHVADLFPKMMQQKDSRRYLLSSELLKRGFRAGKFVATDELRPVMCTIHFSCCDNHFTFAASNGHCMYLYEENTNREDVENHLRMEYLDFAVNIPAKVAKIVSGLLPADDIEIEMAFDTKSIVFTIADTTISYRLYEGNYPNFRAVLPKQSSMVVKIDRAELLTAINRVSVFSEERSSLIALDLKGNNLNLTAESIDFGRSAKENLMLNEVYPTIKIGFNADYLVDILKAIDTTICEIHLTAPEKAAVFKPFESESTTMLLMPLMINN